MTPAESMEMLGIIGNSGRMTCIMLVMCSDNGHEETVTDLVTLQKDATRIEHLGLSLKEAKQLLTTIQHRVLQ